MPIIVESVSPPSYKALTVEFTVPSGRGDSVLKSPVTQNGSFLPGLTRSMTSSSFATCLVRVASLLAVCL